MRKIQMLSWLVIGLMTSNLFLYPADLGYSQVVDGNMSQIAAVSQVNVNTATLDELQQVRGIGPALAERILNYRASNGGFQSLDDLMEVRGIGIAKVARIERQVTF